MKVKSLTFYILVLLSIAYGPAEADWKTCKTPTKQYGLVAPIMPRNLVAFMELSINTSKEIVEQRVFIDSDKSSAALILKDSYSHVHYIYDFLKGTVISITRSGDTFDLDAPAYLDTCKVLHMGDSSVGTFEHLLQAILKQYFLYDRRLVFVDRTQRFGMSVDRYSGCLNYETSKEYMSYKTEFFFSASDLIMPSGYRRAPVTMKAHGVQSFGKTEYHQKEQKNFYFFDNMQPKYHKALEIPEGIYCKGYQDTKPFPKVEKTFVTNVEVLYDQGTYIMGTFHSEQTIYHHREFLSESLLMERLDFVPNGKNSLLGGKYDGKQVTVVHDLSSDSSFVMEKSSGACDFYPHNVIKEGGVSHFRFTNNVIFNNRSDDSYTYKGVEPCGDETCEVWLSDKIDDVKYFTEEISTWTDVRFLSKEWRDRYREGAGKNWPLEVVTYLNSTDLGARNVDTIRLRVYDYLMREPDLEDFDVSSCLIDASRKYYYFELKVPKAFGTATEDHKIKIRSQVTEAFSRAADIPLPRIQDVFIYFNAKSGKAMVTFSITSAYRTKTESKSQPTTLLALSKIEQSLDSNFVIQLQTETGFYQLTAVKNSFKHFFPQKASSNTYESMFLALQRSINLETIEAVKEDGTEKPDTKEDEVKGKYGAGPLAAVIVVMMLLGIVLGSIAVIFYFKKFHDNSAYGPDDLKSFSMEDIIPAPLSDP